MVGSPAKPVSNALDGPPSPDSIPATPGKNKIEKIQLSRTVTRWFNTVSFKSIFTTGFFLLGLAVYLFFFSSDEGNVGVAPMLLTKAMKPTWGGAEWERLVLESCKPRRSENPIVLVTGAAGFVGFHLATALKNRGDGVLGLDNFNNYYDPALKRARQAHLRSQGVMIVEGDINDMDLLHKLFSLVKFTHVAHLAAQAGVRYALENPASYIHSNVAGLVTVFEACRKANPQPAIVWASSSSVYGLNTKVPFSESDRTDHPASLYAATKKAGEEIAHTYNHIYGLSLTALRFFTVYGPWGRPDMAYFSFTQSILDGKPIKVFQGPNKTDLSRDFTYIDDIIDGCVSALDTAEPSTGSGGKKVGDAPLRVFNLGNTQPVSVPNLVDLLEKNLKVKARRVHIRMPRNGDVPFTHANITRAKLELAYAPTTDLKTGVKKFVKWYMSYYGLTRNKGVFPERSRKEMI